MATQLAAQDTLPEQKRAQHRAEARRWYEQAVKEIDTLWRVRPTSDRVSQGIWDFRAEAAEILGIDKKD